MEVSLITAAQQGQRAARARLLEEVGPLLAALVRRLGLPGERDDQLQSLAAHVLTVLDRFEPSGPARFTTWLTTVATRFLLMELRKARPEWVSLEDEHAAPPAFDPSLAAQTRSLAEAVERALERLPGAQRRAFVLTAIEGLSLDEVASLEGVPLGTIKSRLSRARMALAITLGPALDPGGAR